VVIKKIIATVSAKVFEHHKKADGTYNVKICVHHKDLRRYLDTNHFLVKKQLTKDYKIKEHHDLRFYRLHG